MNSEHDVVMPLAAFVDIEQGIDNLQQAVSDTPDRLDLHLRTALDLISRMLHVYSELQQRSLPESGDILAELKPFIKADPSLNAIRDNVRELVFYQNCLTAGAQDQLPKAVQSMLVRTTRHIYLYLRTRLLQQGLLQ